MTRKRDGLYVWVTWLSRMMSGEVTCHWAPWFRTHYTGYDRAPSDFQVAVWTAQHTQLLDEIARERSGLGEGVYREDQNQFRVRRASGLVIAGKPDLIAIDREGQCTVYDIKTGNPGHSDIMQVMLYMLLLPYSSAVYKGKSLMGCVVYKDGNRSGIPAKAIDKDFESCVTYFLNILESDTAPGQTPSPAECRFCELTTVDCPTRRHSDGSEMTPGNEPEIPL
ncbi:MAG: PD-(D/E)XK nuclease family protein [Dehalococcoidia bacterium]|nr:PD-(D/E)XK nuclease family protein [Dehalococcoidia bacterium]